MKKSIRFIISIMAASGLLLSGCAMENKEAIEATEYVSEGESSAEATSTDVAATDSSIVVVKELFEPELEEHASAEASTAATEKEKENALGEEATEKLDIVFFGDSQIANGRDEGTDIPSLLSAKVPNCVVHNLAIGGTTATVSKTTTNYSAGDLTSTCFLGMTYCLAGNSDREATLANYPNVLNTMNEIDPSEVDLYIIEYGANDFINGMALDSNGNEKIGAHALYNALAAGIEQLQEISPDAKIILMTPFYGIYVAGDGSYIGDSYIVSNGIGTLADYAEKVVNVADDYHLYSFDDMFKTKCDLYLDTAGGYLMDNLHLPLTGRQIFARLLSHLVNYMYGYEPYAYLEQDYIKIAEFDPDEVYRYDEHLMKQYYPDSWEGYIKGEYLLAQPSAEALEKYGEQNSDG